MKKIKVALVGNPNIGKTTLFNSLCGLSQKTGNYPGVTIDKKIGSYTFNEHSIEIVDLPGINSLYPKSQDEELVKDYLIDSSREDFPQLVIVLVSALNLKRNLYLFHQVQDLNIPVVLAVNMNDVATKRGVFVNEKELEHQVNCPVVKISARTKEGITKLNELITSEVGLHTYNSFTSIFSNEELEIIRKENKQPSNYHAFLSITNKEIDTDKILQEKDVTLQKLKIDESVVRYKHINSYIKKVLKTDKTLATDFTTRVDKLLLHPILGYVIFIFTLFFMFQSLFVVASYPMDWIDSGVSIFAELMKSWMPAGYFTDLITDGIIPGIGGVVIFIPQIALLFLYFSFLEESGYMSRVVFLMDKMMQRFGMSGKSIVPLMSSFACAIPGIMAARTIENKKERLITILVSPLLTCSARLPVYVILISIAVPHENIGIFNLQGLAMLGMYLIGIVTTFIASLVFKWIIKGEYASTLLLEMPQYLWPSFKNIGITIWKKTSSFVWSAGKIILASSVVLFVLATSGGADFDRAEELVKQNNPNLTTEEIHPLVKSYELENSYLGVIGKTIEPVIQPLGYDWKIGIAVVSSLAAREVFVGTISIIYSIESDEESTIVEKLKQQKNPTTGKAVFNFATALSLLLFYAFSLQCLSTVAVTYKETKSIKWTVVQFAYMSIFAYLSALIAYQTLI